MIVPFIWRDRTDPIGFKWKGVEVGGVLLVAGVWGVFSVVPLRVLFATYRQDPNYSHGWLFPMVAMILLWRYRVPLTAARTGGRWWGVIPLITGGLLAGLGHWYQVAFDPGSLGYVFLLGAGWLLSTAGGLWMLIGWPRIRIVARALWFLVFVIPLPESVLLPVTAFLQKCVAIGSVWTLRWIGVEVFLEGCRLHFPSMELEVAGGCSGIRSLIAMLAAASAGSAYYYLGISQAARMLLIAPVVAVIGNILRILASSLLAQGGMTGWLHGTPHEAMGLIVSGLGGVGLLAGSRHLGKGILPPAGWGRPDCRSFPCSWGTAGATAIVLLSFSSGIRQISRHYEGQKLVAVPLSIMRMPLIHFPQVLGDYQCVWEDPLFPVEKEILQPADHLVRVYEDYQGNWLRLTVLYWESRRAHPGERTVRRNAHTPDICMHYAGWERDPAHDDIQRYEWWPTVPLCTGVYAKAGRERVVVYGQNHDEAARYPAVPRPLYRRLKRLAQTWVEPAPAMLPAVYSLKIETDANGDAPQAKTRSLDFIRRMADILPDYGIGVRGGLGIR